MPEKVENLFLCYTPLHALIARQIIAELRLSTYAVIYVIESDSEKNRYYFSLLSKNAVVSTYLRKNNSLYDVATVWRELRPIVSKYIFENFYTGNIKTFYSRFIIWVLKPRYLKTFDDGVGNVVLGNSYLKNENERFFSHFFFSLFDKGLLYKNVISQIQHHFTIYKYPNVYPKTIYLPFFGAKTNLKKDLPPFTVLLTSALASENLLSASDEWNFYISILEKYDVDLVINHPRNDGFNADGLCNVSVSIEIAEQQILELSKKYSVFVIGTFYSTTLINIPEDFKRLNVVTASNFDFKSYNEFFNSIGIETVSLESIK